MVRPKGSKNKKTVEWKKKNPNELSSFPSWSPKRNRERKVKWYSKNRQWAIQYVKDYRIKHPENRKNRRWINKLIVLTHYSCDSPKCSCCGEHNVEFLSIDHIKGGGESHRRSLHRQSGHPFYVWLIKNDFPEGYRVLCLNCNTSLGLYGYCPHQKGVEV